MEVTCELWQVHECVCIYNLTNIYPVNIILYKYRQNVDFIFFID